jgi:TRAP-type C4-dicarboxylate transport system permease small subunit
MKRKQKIEYLVPASLLIAMTFIVILQIVFRYFFRSPLSWPEEIARWCLVWITFGGQSHSFKNGGLISVDYFVNRFFQKYRRILDKAVNLLVILFYIFLIISGALYTIRMIQSHQYTSVVRAPVAVANISVFIGGLIFLLDRLRDQFIRRDISSSKDKLID